MLNIFVVALLILKAYSFAAESTAEPELLIYPNETQIFAPINESLILVCEFKAEEEYFIDLAWANEDGETIVNNVRGTPRKAKESTLKLIFSNSSIDDSSEYDCIARYSKRPVSTRHPRTVEYKVATLKVDFYEPISFEECPELQNIIAGQEGHVKCPLFSNLVPIISWKKDGSPINSDRINVTDLGLMIPNVTEEDMGTYSLDVFVKETGRNLVHAIEIKVLRSDFCDYLCNSSSIGLEPNIALNLTTEEEFKETCPLFIGYTECIIQYEELCLEPFRRLFLADDYWGLAHARNLCKENTLLHAALVEALKSCDVEDLSKTCAELNSDDRIDKFVEILGEEGLLSHTGHVITDFHFGLMDNFACNLISVEKVCGRVAAFVYLEVFKFLFPLPEFWEIANQLLPEVIRLRIIEDEKEHHLAKNFAVMN